jgi:alpha-L-fucosidase
MHYGIYISPWDRHEKTYGDSPKYNQYFLNQLREVLTNYPGIDEVWLTEPVPKALMGNDRSMTACLRKLIRELYEAHCAWA